MIAVITTFRLTSDLPGEHSADHELISLESDDGSVIFIKLLVKHKNSFPKSGCFDTILGKIRLVLVRKNVIATLAAVRDFRERLRNSYTKCKKKGKNNCKHYAALNVAFGEASADSLKGTMYDPSGDDLEFDLDVAAESTAPQEGRTGIQY